MGSPKLNRYVCHNMNVQLVHRKCLTFLVIMEVEIKSTVRYHFILTTTQRMKTSTAGKDMEGLELSHIVGRKCKRYNILEKGLVVSNSINHILIRIHTQTHMLIHI